MRALLESLRCVWVELVLEHRAWSFERELDRHRLALAYHARLAQDARVAIAGAQEDLRLLRLGAHQPSRFQVSGTRR